MIIIDTSVWIEFLKGNFEYSNIVIDFIENREVLFLECIASELLQGVKNKREKEVIISYWKLLPKISMNNLWIKGGLYSSENNMISKGIGLIDTVIIVATKETKSKLWTLDKKILNNIEDEIIFKP